MTPIFYVGKRGKSVLVGVYHYYARIAWGPGRFGNGSRWFSGIHDIRKEPEY